MGIQTRPSRSFGSKRGGAFGRSFLQIFGTLYALPYKKLEMHTCRKLKNDFSLLLLFPPNPLSRRNIFDFQINARGPPVLYIIHGASQVIVCHHSSPFQSFFRSPFYQRSSSIYFSNIYWQSIWMKKKS